MKYRITSYVLLLVALCAIGYGWAQHKEAELLSNDRFIDFRIEPAYNLVVASWKSNNKLAWDSSDRNNDTAEDSTVLYGTTGQRSTAIMDNDFNGRFEETRQYNAADKLTDIYRDVNEDGYWELWVTVQEDSVMMYNDANGDGAYSSLEVVYRGSVDGLTY